MNSKFGCVFAALLFLGFIPVTSAFAAPPAARSNEQTTAAPASPDAALDRQSVAVFAKQIDDAETELDSLSLNVRAGGLSDAKLRNSLAAVLPIQDTLDNALAGLNPRLRRADERLAQLGPAPGPGQPPEDPETTSSRLEILHYRQSVDVEVKQARLLTTEADQLTRYLTERRRRLFSERLWMRTRSILNPQLWIDFGRTQPSELGKVTVTFDQEADLTTARAGSATGLAIWGLAAFLAAMFLLPVRAWISRWGQIWLTKHFGTEHNAPKLIAIWRILIAGLTPLLVGVTIQAALRRAGLLTPLFDGLLSLLWKSVVYGALLGSITDALLGLASWRSTEANRLRLYPILIAVSMAGGGFLAGLNNLIGTSNVIGECTGYLMLVFQLGVIVTGLSRAGRARMAGAEIETAPEDTGAWPLWIVMAIVAWLTLASAAAAIVAGYLAFATFIVRELAWAAAIIAAIYLLIGGTDSIITRLLSPAHPLGRTVRISIGLSERGLAQVAELIAGLIWLALILGGWVAVLAPLGADAEDVFGRITSNSLVLQFGQVTISPGAVAGALLVLGIGLAATRTLRGWLEVRYLPKTRMDLGVRHSLAAVVSYICIFVAFLVTCAYLGLNLDRIALFASALTVGIGFGLQAVIGNFVSGLILLAERPVKVGDRIAVGDLEGDIRRISVRATEIEMGDLSRLIVPNSELVTKIVRNVTRGGAHGLAKIVLSLETTNDPQAVRDLLMRHLKALPNALHEPPPAVYLTDVKDGAMEFTAFVHLPSPRAAFKAKSDLLFQIIPDLKAHGMTLASSNPVVHLTTRDNPGELN
jgi:small-conductance mechanosensitive channel